jgi:hypothetical protein
MVQVNERERSAAGAVEQGPALELDGRTRREVDRTIAAVNALVSAAAQQHDRVADIVFEACWGANYVGALEAGSSPTKVYAALHASAGDALELSRPQLRRAVRIGALNRRLAGGPWAGLSFSVKQELLPLVAGGRDLQLVEAGAKFAAKPGVSSRAVRAWVAKKLGAPGDGPAEEAVPTFASWRKAVEVGAALGRSVDRQAYVTRIVQLPDDERDTCIARLKATGRNFEKLLQALEAALAES